MNKNPPEASPNLLVNVSIKTVDLYFSFEDSVVKTASLAGLFNPYSNGLIVPWRTRNSISPVVLRRYSEKYPEIAKNPRANKKPYIVKTNLIPKNLDLRIHEVKTNWMTKVTIGTIESALPNTLVLEAESSV